MQARFAGPRKSSQLSLFPFLRRLFVHIVRAVVAAAFVAALIGMQFYNFDAKHATRQGQVRTPTGSIRHVVILFQENRSFNTMFMGFPRRGNQ